MSVYSKSARKSFIAINKLPSNPNTEKFIYSCWKWFIFTETIETKTEKIYRIEDLQSIENIKEMFKTVTDLSIIPIQTIRSMVGLRINPHVGIGKEYNPQKVYFDEWDNNQRFLFDTICGEKMKKFYKNFQEST